MIDPMGIHKHKNNTKTKSFNADGCYKEMNDLISPRISKTEYLIIVLNVRVWIFLAFKGHDNSCVMTILGSHGVECIPKKFLDVLMSG